MKTIPLTQGKEAIVDDDVFEWARQRKWHVSDKGYARTFITRVGGPQVYQTLHRMILNPPPGLEVDHRNGNKLDNRRDNLRPATRTDNGRAFRAKSPGMSSRFRGVTIIRKTGRWTATIGITEGGETAHKYLGVFADQISAAKAYNRAAQSLGFKPEALNPIPDQHAGHNP